MQKKTYNHMYIEKLCPVSTSNRKNHVQAKAGVKTVKTNYFRRRRDQ